MKARVVGWALATAVVASLASGCLRARAKSVSDAPPLAAPAAPARVIETVDATPVAPLPLVEEPQHQPIRPPVGSTTPARAGVAAPRAQDAPRTEPPPLEQPPAAEAPPRQAPTLQTTPAGAEVEVERAIRAVIFRTNTDLSRVDYQRLNRDARNQYDTAKRFIQQADEALRPPRNLVFAKNMADKAAALAAQLAGR